MKLPPEQVQEVDIPELPETFSDSLGMSTFDEMTMRITFCVQRVQPPKPPKPPFAKKYPVCRMILTIPAVVELFNQLNQMMQVLNQQGLVKIEAGKPAEATTKH
jgi:hypothetical protein